MGLVGNLSKVRAAMMRICHEKVRVIPPSEGSASLESDEYRRDVSPLLWDMNSPQGAEDCASVNHIFNGEWWITPVIRIYSSSPRSVVLEYCENSGIPALIMRIPGHFNKHRWNAAHQEKPTQDVAIGLTVHGLLPAAFEVGLKASCTKRGEAQMVNMIQRAASAVQQTERPEDVILDQDLLVNMAKENVKKIKDSRIWFASGRAKRSAGLQLPLFEPKLHATNQQLWLGSAKFEQHERAREFRGELRSFQAVEAAAGNAGGFASH
jgi:hypothetical protein